MNFSKEVVHQILGIKEAYKAPEAMLAKVLDPEQRVAMFKQFLAVSDDLSHDWFHEYYEDEQAERKKKKQDFTPDSISILARRLLGTKQHDNGTRYEPTAGTGGMLIKLWDDDLHRDPVTPKLPDSAAEAIKILTGSFFTYDPRSYWYHAEELSGRAIPFLLFNMSIRGMNGVVIQINALSRVASNAWFIRNDSPDVFAFSEIIPIPHDRPDIMEFLEIKKWEDD